MNSSVAFGPCPVGAATRWAKLHSIIITLSRDPTLGKQPPSQGRVLGRPWKSWLELFRAGRQRQGGHTGSSFVGSPATPWP